MSGKVWEFDDDWTVASLLSAATTFSLLLFYPLFHLITSVTANAKYILLYSIVFFFLLNFN